MLAPNQITDIESKQSTTTIQSRDTTPADSNFGTPVGVDYNAPSVTPPGGNQQFMYQQVNQPGQNFTPMNGGQQMLLHPNDPAAQIPHDHSGFHPNMIPHDPSGFSNMGQQMSGPPVLQHQPSHGNMSSANSAVYAMTPGNNGMYQPGMTPGNHMSPGPMHYGQGMTPGNQLSPQFLQDPHGVSPGQFSPPPMMLQSQPSQGHLQQVGYPPVCMPAGAPLDPNAEIALMGLGDLPSIGSAGHCNGTCKRCCFHEKGRCQNGAACLFCHYPHEKRVRKSKKNKMKSKTGVRMQPQ